MRQWNCTDMSSNLNWKIKYTTDSNDYDSKQYKRISPTCNSSN